MSKLSYLSGMVQVVFVGVVLIAGLLSTACKRQNVTEAFTREITSPEELSEHSMEFEKEVVKVTDRIHVAVGFGLANSIMVEGDDGLIIIDAMESMEEGAEVLSAFKTISDKPVSAIIYTHNHTDHVFGAQAIAGEDDPEVIAHEDMPYHLDRIATVIRPVIEKRSYRMFGNYLSQDELVNCGIGPHLSINANTELGVIRPTVTFTDSMNINISGIDLQLFHAPGETPDQLFVWIPEEKALMCGDNLYKTFPNLYTIRGTSHRDLNHWRQSLDKMRRFPVEHLVPSHTRPIQGRESINGILTDYRDAIQFVHDQTVRYMNLGMTPDQIVEKVRLPEHLAESPYLQEFYGKVEWTVRSVFNGYLGWFDGNPSTLLPLDQLDEAQRMAQLAGGEDKLIRTMKEAADQKDMQWALQLTDHVLILQPDHADAERIRRDCLMELGMAQANPNARHYYITMARELEGLKNEGLITPGKEMVHAIPMASVFNGMATFLNAEKAADVEKTIVFNFTDTEEAYSVIIRKGVAEVQPYAVADADHTITTESTIWKEIAAEIRKPLPAIASGKLKIEGGKIAFAKVMNLFDR